MSESARSLNAPFVLSISAIAVAGVFLLLSLSSMISTVALASTASPGALKGDEQMLSRHQALMVEYQHQLKVRALFGKPAPQPPVITVATQPSIQAIEIQSQIEVRYPGPNLIALLGSKAWFKPAAVGEDAMRLSIGQEHAGVTLLAVDAPWTARVRYREIEFTLTLFDENRTEPHFVRAPMLNRAVPGLAGPNDAMNDDDVFGDRGGLR